jgi:hypothetical protein
MKALIPRNLLLIAIISLTLAIVSFGEGAFAIGQERGQSQEGPVVIELEPIESPRDISQPVPIRVQIKQAGQPLREKLEVTAQAIPIGQTQGPAIALHLLEAERALYGGQFEGLQQEGRYNLKITARSEVGVVGLLEVPEAFAVYPVPLFGTPQIIGPALVGQPFTVAVRVSNPERLQPATLVEARIKRTDQVLMMAIPLRREGDMYVGKAEPIKEAGSYQLSIYLPETFTTNGIRIGGKELEAVAVEFKAPGPNWRVFLLPLAILFLAFLGVVLVYERALTDSRREWIISTTSRLAGLRKLSSFLRKREGKRNIRKASPEVMELIGKEEFRPEDIAEVLGRRAQRVFGEASSWETFEGDCKMWEQTLEGLYTLKRPLRFFRFPWKVAPWLKKIREGVWKRVVEDAASHEVKLVLVAARVFVAVILKHSFSDLLRFTTELEGKGVSPEFFYYAFTMAPIKGQSDAADFLDAWGKLLAAAQQDPKLPSRQEVLEHLTKLSAWLEKHQDLKGSQVWLRLCQFFAQNLSQAKLDASRLQKDAEEITKYTEEDKTRQFMLGDNVLSAFRYLQFHKFERGGSTLPILRQYIADMPRSIRVLFRVLEARLNEAIQGKYPLLYLYPVSDPKHQVEKSIYDLWLENRGGSKAGNITWKCEWSENPTSLEQLPEMVTDGQEDLEVIFVYRGSKEARTVETYLKLQAQPDKSPFGELDSGQSEPIQIIIKRAPKAASVPKIKINRPDSPVCTVDLTSSGGLTIQVRYEDCAWEGWEDHTSIYLPIKLQSSSTAGGAL